jgi:dihydrofolate synthase/folylpolyglutamate synthase
VRIGDAAFELPLPALAGRHQIDNAGLAVACALALADLAPDAPALARGLRAALWPGRLQRLTRGPLVALLPATCELWLDGGHNPAAGEALAASLNRDDPRPLHLVVGMLNTKDEAGFLRPLSTLARSLRTVPVPGEPASRDPAEAAALALRLGIPATPARDLAGALRAIAAAEPGPARVLICGSLYLAGHVLRDHG